MPPVHIASEFASRPIVLTPAPEVILPVTFPASAHAKSALRGQLGRGEIRRVMPGVYTREGEIPSGIDRSLWQHQLKVSASAWKLTADESVSHLSGAVLWGLWGFAPPHLVYTTSPQRFARQPVGRQRVCSEVEQGQLAERSGVPVTGLERTAVDSMRVLPMHRALAVADCALRHGADLQSMIRINEQLQSNRFRQPTAFVLSLAYAGTDSPPESHLRLIAHLAGVPRIVPQLSVCVAGETFHLDVGDPTVRLALEYDGQIKYRDDPKALYREKLREDSLRRAGWTVMRFTARDFRNPAHVVLRIQRVLERLGVSGTGRDFPGRSTLFSHWK